MKNVRCCRPNHMQPEIYLFIYLLNVTGYIITSEHQRCNIVLVQESRAWHNKFHAWTQNKSLCYAKHAAPVQTLFGNCGVHCLIKYVLCIR